MCLINHLYFQFQGSQFQVAFRFQPRPSNPLNCTHVVEGHSNSVLAVKVNDNNLYTAAAGNSSFSTNDTRFL